MTKTKNTKKNQVVATTEANEETKTVTIESRLQVKVLGKTADDSARRIIAQTANGTDKFFFNVPAGQLDGIVTVLGAVGLKAEGPADNLIVSVI